MNQTRSFVIWHKHTHTQTQVCTVGTWIKYYGFNNGDLFMYNSQDFQNLTLDEQRKNVKQWNCFILKCSCKIFEVNNEISVKAMLHHILIWVDGEHGIEEE